MDIEKIVKRTIAEHLGLEPEDIDVSSSFDSMGADSLDLIEIVMDVEEELLIEIPDEDAEKITTTQEAVDYVKLVMA